MATITTGDTDILRTYYELRMGTYDVFESVYQFLERHWYETSVSPQTLLMGPETGTSIFYSDGSTFSVEGTLSEHPTEWRIIKIEAQLSGSDDRIVFEGNMSFDSEFKIAPGSSINTVTVFDPAGGMQLLNRNAMPSSAQLIGNLQIETNGNPFASIMYTEKSASWDDGLKLRLLGQTFDSNESGASEMTQTIDTVIVEQNGEEIFRIDDFGFVNSALTDEILDAGPDAFIEHFLSGDDDITGTNGNDAIYSGDGNDMVQSGAGDDAVDSGDGDDEIIGGSGLGDDYYDGGSGTDVVKYTSATSGIEVNLAEGFARSLQGDAQIGTDTLIRIESVIGGSFSDRLVGDAQANWFKGGSGDDEIIGGAGIDTAQYDEAKSTVTNNGSVWTVFGDQLTGIERIEFSNANLAIDIDGSAGQTAKTLAAVLGSDSLSNKQYVGLGLQLFDAGQSLETVCGLALQAGGATTNEQVVNMLFSNLYGEAPTAELAQPFVDALNAGAYSQGFLAAAAAELTDDFGVIDLVGLTETGIEYV